MLEFKHAIVAAALLALAQPGYCKNPTFSSEAGRLIYKETKHVPGHYRTTEVTASKCEKKTKSYEAAGPKTPTCTLKIYCYIGIKTSTTQDKVLKSIEEHTMGISNAVVTATCPRKGETCPEIEKCIDDAKADIDGAAVLRTFDANDKKKESGKSDAK